jgi:hypothetical protein
MFNNNNKLQVKFQMLEKFIHFVYFASELHNTLASFEIPVITAVVQWRPN